MFSLRPDNLYPACIHQPSGSMVPALSVPTQVFMYSPLISTEGPTWSAQSATKALYRRLLALSQGLDMPETPTSRSYVGFHGKKTAIRPPSPAPPCRLAILPSLVRPTFPPRSS